MNLSKYNKSIAALATGALGWGAVVIASAPAHITASEWLGLGVVIVTAVGVRQIPNTPDAVGAQSPAMPAPSISPIGNPIVNVPPPNVNVTPTNINVPTTPGVPLP